MQTSERKIDRQVKFESSELTISAIDMKDGVHLDISGEPQAYWYPVLCTIIFYAFEPVKLLETAIRIEHELLAWHFVDHPPPRPVVVFGVADRSGVTKVAQAARAELAPCLP